MNPKIVIISFLVCCFLGGCVNNVPPKKSEKAKHKERELFPLEKILKEAKVQKDYIKIYG